MKRTSKYPLWGQSLLAGSVLHPGGRLDSDEVVPVLRAGDERAGVGRAAGGAEQAHAGGFPRRRSFCGGLGKGGAALPGRGSNASPQGAGASSASYLLGGLRLGSQLPRLRSADNQDQPTNHPTEGSTFRVTAWEGMCASTVLCG